MQKNSSIALALFILFQGLFAYVNISFEISEVLADYQIHKMEQGDSLLTFFSKHYGKLKEAHKTAHQEEHKKHKHHNEMELHFHIDFVCDNQPITLAKTVEILTQKLNFYYKDLFSTFEKQKIFQPPRLA